MMNEISQLTRLKEEIEEHKEAKAKWEGKLATFYDKLKEDFGIKSLEDAEHILETTEKEIKKTQNNIDKMLKDISDAFDGKE